MTAEAMFVVLTRDRFRQGCCSTWILVGLVPWLAGLLRPHTRTLLWAGQGVATFCGGGVEPRFDGSLLPRCQKKQILAGNCFTSSVSQSRSARSARKVTVLPKTSSRLGCCSRCRLPLAMRFATALLAVVAVIQLPSYSSLATTVQVDCLDNDGNSVPWWFMYKTRGAYEFAYVDGSTTSKTISKFPRFMNDTKNPIALTRTLRSVVEEKAHWFQYNDQPDIGTASSSYGHSKGLVAIDASGSGSGFWLTHSTPHFPASSGSAEFYFPQTEIKYGQTFLCMKLSDKDTIENIGAHLQLIKPFVYLTRMDLSQLSDYPNILNVLNGNWTKENATHVGEMSVGGLKMTTLSKNTAWNNALWGALVAPHFEQHLVVQSWIRGYAEGAYCPPNHTYEVVDTLTLRMPDGNGTVQYWTEGSDHAKWAISSTDGSSLVCVGDINRMTSQFKRGGGAVCFESPVLHSQLSDVVNSTTSCA